MARTRRSTYHKSCWNKDFIIDCERGHVEGRSTVYARGSKEHVQGKNRRFWKNHLHATGRRNSKADIEFQLTHF